MTLVPIIYTSLIIFASLLTLVIFISYIAFRIKSRNTIHPSAAAADYAYRPRPAFVQTPAPQRIPIQYKPQPLRLSYYPSSQKNNYQTYPKPYEENYIKHDNSRVTNDNRRSSFTQEPQRKTRQIERLEIMNQSERFRRTSEFDDMPIQSSGSISDSNLLSYYSDRTDLEFSVLNANYLRNAL